MFIRSFVVIYDDPIWAYLLQSNNFVLFFSFTQSMCTLLTSMAPCSATLITRTVPLFTTCSSIKSFFSFLQVQLDYNQLTTINACAFDNATAVGELLLIGNPLHCDCAVAWTSLPGKSGTLNVYGKCKTPIIASGQEISQGDKFHVCRYIGLEHCKSRSTLNNVVTTTTRYNDILQPDGQRYRRNG